MHFEYRRWNGNSISLVSCLQKRTRLEKGQRIKLLQRFNSVSGCVVPLYAESLTMVLQIPEVEDIVVDSITEHGTTTGKLPRCRKKGLDSFLQKT